MCRAKVAIYICPKRIQFTSGETDVCGNPIASKPVTIQWDRIRFKPNRRIKWDCGSLHLRIPSALIPKDAKPPKDPQVVFTKCQEVKDKDLWSGQCSKGFEVKVLPSDMAYEWDEWDRHCEWCMRDDAIVRRAKHVWKDEPSFDVVLQRSRAIQYGPYNAPNRYHLTEDEEGITHVDLHPGYDRQRDYRPKYRMVGTSDNKQEPVSKFFPIKLEDGDSGGDAILGAADQA